MNARPVSILLADLVHPNNQIKTFPYAAGCVGAAAAASLGHRVSIEIFRSPEALGEAFERTRPQIMGFTNYLWNLELGYEVIRRAKTAAPDTVVVMGGPNYPTDPDAQGAFFRRYPLIDFYVYKEGETPFSNLTARLLEAELDAAKLKRQRPVIPAVHYMVEDDLVAPQPAPRQRDLDDFPSPYLSGLLDKFFAQEDLAALIQTKRGCPFQCTFCVEGESYYSKLGSVSTARFRAELDYIAKRMAGGCPVLYIADSNFGMYEHDLEICDAIAEARERYGWPETMDVSTGKNRKERVIDAVKRTNGAMRFGPALQTTDRQTLANVKRSNISESILMEMAGAARELDQRTYTELILGLPGETVASHLRSIEAAIEAGIQRIKMYPLVLLPGTEMASEASRQAFGLQSRFRVHPQCHGSYRFLGETFPSVEVSELVVATSSMTLEEYLYCKRFDLSVEIFYNDGYLEEVHGLIRALALPMFDFIRRCQEQLDRFPEGLKSAYRQIEEGIRENLWASRDACLEHFRNPANLEDYVRREYKTSIATLKAVALVEHSDAVLSIAREALDACIRAAGVDRPSIREYVEDVIEYSRLRRYNLPDTTLEPEATFRFAFDRITQRGFLVDPDEFRLRGPRKMRFWHDQKQAQDIQALCARVSNPMLRARSFVYPETDPSANPYLRRSAFC